MQLDASINVDAERPVIAAATLSNGISRDSLHSGTRFLTPQNSLQELEFGFGGERPDFIVLVNASGISTGGPVTQLLQMGRGFEEVFSNEDFIPQGFIGTRPDVMPNDPLRGSLPEHLADLQFDTEHAADRFHVVSSEMNRVIHGLAAEGRNKILIVSNGYTGYVPFAVKSAVDSVNRNGSAGNPVKVKLLMQDSSLPDSDNPSYDLHSESGYPMDRFFPPSYASNQHVDVMLGCNNWLPVNPADDASRAPAATTCLGFSLPFSPSVIRYFHELRTEVTREDARAKLALLLQKKGYDTFTSLMVDGKNLFVPLIVSDGCFDRDNIGKWMTSEQFLDVIDGCNCLVGALGQIAARNRRNIVFSGSEGFVSTIRQLQHRGVLDQSEAPVRILHRLEKPNLPSQEPTVIVVEAPDFRYEDYPYYKLAAECVVHRSSQANSHGEDILMGIPTILVTMPAHNYMSVETMDSKFTGRHFLPDHDPRIIAGVLEHSMTNRAEAVEYQDQLFAGTMNVAGSNFWNVVSHLAGVKPNGKLDFSYLSGFDA